MTKTLKQLVHVLWAIEKDLHVIASNKEVSEKESSFSVTVSSPNTGCNSIMTPKQIVEEINNLDFNEEMTIRHH